MRPTTLRRRGWLYPALTAGVVLLVTTDLSDVGSITGGDIDLATALVLATATFVAQVLPVHLTTKGGRHTVSLTDAVLAAGLLVTTPTVLLLAMGVGVAPALLRTRPSPLVYMANFAHSMLGWSLATWVFHRLTVAGGGVTEQAVLLAVATSLLTVVVSAIVLRIPIGLATGKWRFAEGELRALMTTAPIAIAAVTAAVLGVVLASISWLYVALLLLPVAQVAVSLVERARAEEARRVLDVAITESERLRRAVDVTGALRRAVDEMRAAYDVAYALLVVEREDGLMDHVAGDPTAADTDLDTLRDALRRWAVEHAASPPVTEQSVAGRDLLDIVGDRGFLVIPIGTERQRGAVLLVDRHLGSFREDHVELSRTLGSAMSTALERQSLSTELDAAGRREAELEQRASHDQLTGLANRRLLERDLQLVADAAEPVAVVYIDLTGFKAVNDTHGHRVGDQVLVETAHRLQSCVRRGDLVARLGGDEFAVLLRTESMTRATDVAERILDALAAPFSGDVQLPSIRAAVGIASGAPGENGAQLLDRADRAMYAAKEQGSRAVVIAEPTPAA